MKYKEKIIPGAYLLIIIGLTYFALKILLAGINEKIDGLQTEVLDQEIRGKKIASLAQVKADFEKVHEQGEALNVLLSESETIALIKEIEDISAKTGNEVKNEIEERSKEKKEGGKKAKKEEGGDAKGEQDIVDKFSAQNLLKMKISLFGSYDSVAHFVQQIENIKHWSTILGVRFVNHDLRERDNVVVRSPFSNNQSKGIESERPKQEKMSAVIDMVFFAEGNE